MLKSAELQSPGRVRLESVEVIDNLQATRFIDISACAKKSKVSILRGRGTHLCTFTDPVQSLPLDFVFVRQRHGVAARLGTARLGSAGSCSVSSAADSDEVPAPSAQSALLPGAYRRHTHLQPERQHTLIEQR